MKKRIWSKAVSIFTAILLVVGIVPNTTITALAAAPSGQELYVGDVQISSTGYWTTGSDGTVTSAGNTQPGDNYIHYNANDNILTLHNATIKKGLAYDQNTPAGSTIHGSAIGMLNQSGDAELTVQLEGSNTIDEVSTGIYVHSSGGGAALSITGNGTLVIDSTFCPIQVISFNGNAALSIENAKVTATSSYYNGVTVQSGNSENSSASLTVNGGSLTATASSANVSGICLLFGTGGTSDGTPTVTVSNNAIVRANGSAGGITSNSSTGIQYETGSDSTGGIVFDGKNGTVYGDVTLQEDITINQGESLTIRDGASLNTGNNKVIVNGGTLNGEDKITGTVKYAPSITTKFLPEGKVNEEYATSLSANGSEPITWNVTDGNLPTGLNLSTNGKITGIPTAPGDYVFTVTASNDAGSVSKELTIHVKDVDPIYSIQNSGDISFADTLEGYTPEVKTIMITNDGNQPITLDQPSSTSFDVGTLSKAELNAGETAEFTVQPKTGLLASVYDEDIVVTGNSNGQSVTTTVNVKFNVKHNAVKVERKDPTCTEDGNIDYWYCEACKKYFQDEALTREIKKEESIIKAKGHNAVKTEEKLATCTEDGNIEYWYCDVCKKYFSDAEFKNEISFDKTVIPTTGHNLIKIEAKDPTIDGTGNIEYWYCEVCNKYFSDEKAEHEITLEDTVIAKLPKLVSGANQEWTKRSKEGLTFKVDTDINEFKKVLVDGKELKDTDYDIKSGSTILTLKPSFLDTLSAGKHKIRFEFNTGSVEAYFTVKDKENSSQTESANTGVQNKYGLWIVLLLVAAGGLAGFGILSKRRKNHK